MAYRNKNEWTTIAIKKQTRDLLKLLRKHEKQPFEEVIDILCKRKFEDNPKEEIRAEK